MKKIQILIPLFILMAAVPQAKAAEYVVVDTGQDACYDNNGATPYPYPNQPFYGQDAQFESAAPAYQGNGDGTVTDLNTGLMWSKAVDDDKLSLVEAEREARRLTLGGHRDWRVPNIKELYSLIDFRGNTGFSGREMSSVPGDAIPFINTDFFDFKYGQINAEERYIDAQWLTSTKYVSTTMGGSETLFGVNFADGRIKGYGYSRPGSSREKKFYVRYVRGRPYGRNNFADNGDGTITDSATGLMWTKDDSGSPMRWKEALAHAENLNYGGYDDWRLPNAKELQYIVDYSRSPDTTDSPAIDPIFRTTSIINEAGDRDYPYYWTSTTHLDGPKAGENAAYVAFGRAPGKMQGKVMDVHGAGAQRSDPKTGNADFRGPQGDAIRIENYIRCVRGGKVIARTDPPMKNNSGYPHSINVQKGFSQATGRSREELGPPRRGSGSRGKMPSFVERLDRNGDRRVSRMEFDGPPDRFDDHDRNGDGYLSEDERPKEPPMHQRMRRR